MAIEFTEQQKRVLQARNHDLLVSAAAGSGKTAVLVERIVRMISRLSSSLSCTFQPHIGPMRGSLA